MTRIGARLSRRYVLYVSETQPQANRHAQSIAAMLERLGIPRALNEYGASVGWRHEELRTADGFNLTALGLDAAVRGVKIDQFRPDLIVFDDVDGREDSELVRRKKVNAITTSILPAAGPNAAVLVVQNLVTRESIVSQLVDGSAGFLVDREIGTLEPAVRDLEVERDITADGARYRIVGGTPTWDGQDLRTCEAQINDWGLAAFRREAQHEVDEVEGGLWDRERDIEPFRVTDHPPLTAIAVGLDPSATATGDEAGIIVAGRDARGHGYLLDDRSLQGAPSVWAAAAVAAYRSRRASALLAESNQGGQMIAVTIGTIPGAPAVQLIHSADGKQTRAEPIQQLAAAGKIHHVGQFPQLERELCRWRKGMPSPNRLDAYVLALTNLLLGRPFSAAAGGSRNLAPVAVGGSLGLRGGLRR